MVTLDQVVPCGRSRPVGRSIPPVSGPPEPESGRPECARQRCRGKASDVASGQDLPGVGRRRPCVHLPPYRQVVHTAPRSAGAHEGSKPKSLVNRSDNTPRFALASIDLAAHTLHVGILLHSLHIAMIVLGGAVVCVLLRATRPVGQGSARSRRAARERAATLRAAGGPEALVAAAYATAHAELGVREVQVERLPWKARLIRAVAFAAVALDLGVVAHRLTEDGWPPLWLLGACLVVLVGLGWVVLPRSFVSAGVPSDAAPAWKLAALVTGSQLLLNAAFSAVALLVSGSAVDWTRVLFCYHSGKAPTAAAVNSARTALGLSAPASTGTGVLVWAAFAHLAAAVLLGAYLVICERASSEPDGLREQLHRAQSLGRARGLVGRPSPRRLRSARRTPARPRPRRVRFRRRSRPASARCAGPEVRQGAGSACSSLSSRPRASSAPTRARLAISSCSAASSSLSAAITFIPAIAYGSANCADGWNSLR